MNNIIKTMSKDAIEPIVNRLTKGLWTQIAAYMTGKEIAYPFMAICQRLYTMCIQDGTIIARSFFNHIKVPYKYGAAEFAGHSPGERLQLMREIFDTNCERLSLFSYFTDGGVDKANSHYFIGNIYTEEAQALYSSVRGENVHVKSFCSSLIPSNFTYDDLSTYIQPSQTKDIVPKKLGNETYRIPLEKLIAKHETQSTKRFAVCKYYDINRNITSYTCLVQSFAVFVSMEEIPVDCPIVRVFDGVNSTEMMQELGFEFVTLQEDTGTMVVEFILRSPKSIEEQLQKKKGKDARLNGVYPLIWGTLDNNISNYFSMTQRIGFKHLLLKLIDSHKSSGDGNIDCHNSQITGTYICLKESHEE